MSEFVRVKHDVFGEYSVPEWAVDPETQTVIDKAAVDQNGDVLPGKPKTSVASKAKAKNTSTNGDEPAETPKEGSA